MFKVIRNLLSQNCRCSENDCGCNNETFLLQLAIVAAFFFFTWRFNSIYIGGYFRAKNTGK